MRTLVAIVFVISAAMASGQSPAGGGQPQSPGNGVGAQSYSVEGDLLSDEANQSNADAIVCDISPGVFSKGDPSGNKPPKCDFRKKGLVQGQRHAPIFDGSHIDVLPALAVGDVYYGYAPATSDSCRGTGGNTRASRPGCVGCKSLTGVETAISSTLTILQTIAGFFATNQSITGIQGTPQDQPLVAAVARRLLSMKANVYTPSIYSPYSLTGLDYTQSPFLANLAALETTENKLSAELFNTNLKLNQANQTLSSKQAQLTALQAKAWENSHSGPKGRNQQTNGRQSGVAIDDQPIDAVRQFTHDDDPEHPELHQFFDFNQCRAGK